MKSLVYIFLIFSIFSLSCKENTSSKTKNKVDAVSNLEESNHPYYVTNLEFAHEKNNFLKNEVVCFNLDMTFGSNSSKMKIFSTTNSSSIRVDKMNGTSTIMKDGKIYTNAKPEKWNSEKFGIYTYQYFFMAPYKFSDPGTKWQQLAEMNINSKLTDRAKLTFEKGTGDAPDDWYIVHSDPESKLVEYIGYIVTGGGTSVEEAEKSAHAIEYLDYTQVDGIPIATKWNFYTYDQDEGLGKKIGEGSLRNVEFFDNVDQFLAAEEDGYVLIK